MNAKALRASLLLTATVSLFVACGGDDDDDAPAAELCTPGEVVCLHEHGGQICSTDGKTELPFACNSGERCEEGEDGADACVGECSPGEKSCATAAVSRICSESGREWISVACEPGTGCSDESGDCERKGDVTVAVCESGESVCADATTVKSCELDRSGFRYRACAENERCDAGACELDPEKGCVPQAGSCVDGSHVRRCNEDGTAYGEVEACAGGTRCEDGGCQGPICTAGAVRCDDVGLGSSDLVRALAAGTLSARAVYTCDDDGAGWTRSECEAAELCVYAGVSAAAVNAYVADLKAAIGDEARALPSFDLPASARATCRPPECASAFALRELYGSVNETGGSFACGDPRDDDAEPADFLRSFSLCEGLPPYANLHWANYACPEASECAYTSVLPLGGGSDAEAVTVPTCASECHPGAVACYADDGAGSEASGVGAVGNRGEFTIRCGDDGHWDSKSLERCVSEDGRRELWCGPDLRTSNDHFDLGRCMEPACSYWFDQFDTFALPDDAGACGSDGSFRHCLADGSFADARECARCVPAATGTPETYAGFEPGRCEDCREHEQFCVEPSTDAGGTPFYYQCKDGAWVARTCSGGDVCRDYVERADPDDSDYGLPKIVCGGECAPFGARCVDELGVPGGKRIQRCNDDGEYEAATACEYGACHDDEQGVPHAGSAHCEGECLRGSVLCVNGHAIPCSSSGRFDEESDDVRRCTGATPLCIDGFGCAACDPGTLSQAPDVICGSDHEIVRCGSDGRYEDPIDCPADHPRCAPGRDGGAARCVVRDGGGGSGNGGSSAGGSGGTSGNAGSAADSSGGTSPD